MTKVKFLVIDFSHEERKIFPRIEEREEKESHLEDFYEIIGCDYIDIVPVNEEVAIVVDDEGLLKSQNLVFEIRDNKSGFQHQLAGRLVFVKNGQEDVRGFTAGEVFELQLKIQLGQMTIIPIGITA